MVSLLTLGIAHASMALPSLNRSLLNYSFFIAAGDHSTFNTQHSTLKFNIQHSTFNIIKAYEEEFLGSRDSHSDSGADGGTDRTGNDELHGVWSVLRTEMRNEK
jgi:hypothetical protein